MKEYGVERVVARRAPEPHRRGHRRDHARRDRPLLRAVVVTIVDEPPRYRARRRRIAAVIEAEREPRGRAHEADLAPLREMPAERLFARDVLAPVALVDRAQQSRSGARARTRRDRPRAAPRRIGRHAIDRRTAGDAGGERQRGSSYSASRSPVRLSRVLSPRSRCHGARRAARAPAVPVRGEALDPSCSPTARAHAAGDAAVARLRITRTKPVRQGRRRPCRPACGASRHRPARGAK